MEIIFQKTASLSYPEKSWSHYILKQDSASNPFDEDNASIPNLRDTLIWQQSPTCKDSARIFVQGMGGLPPYEYELDSSGVWLSNGDFRNLNPAAIRYVSG